MSIRRLIFFVLVAIAFLLATGMPTTSSDLIVGRNVNMVSGTDFIGGDPYLQRQNEPSIAVSTRNPLHLLAGANDYRTIDIPFRDELPGIPEGTAARDAWLGVFKSIDGGQSWTSTLLPGYPQDISIEATTSPLSGYDAACDPVVRAGTNGLFYYSGIAFNRAERGAGVVFVARFIDNNNIEGSDTIAYIDTNIVDQGNAGQFLDMPSIAVDIPRSMTNTAMIRTAGDLSQNIPCGNVYITYTAFLGNTIENVRSRILFAMSTDCGVNWSKPIKVSESQHILQRPTIVIDPSDPTGDTIYLAFRRFAHGKAPDAIVIVKSVDGGQTFTKPIEVATFDPFDQGTSTYSFRTNSYPTLAVDGGGIVYLAWAQRMGGPDGFARIVMKTSPDGLNWPSQAFLVDVSVEARGHQFMPSLAFNPGISVAGNNANGKLMMAWLDQRDDLACLADPTDPNKYFTKYIEDFEVRHTIDVRAALIEPGLTPSIYPSERVSRYLHILELDAKGDWIEDPPGFAKVQQAEFNPPNYTLFQLGTVPFHGDWLEIVPSIPSLPPASGMSQAPSFHVVWTDNRDVRPPGGDWWVFPWPTSNYNAPDSGHNTYPCSDGELTGVRNQNIYTASITSGILVGSLGNTKPADDVQHTYIIFVKNTTSELRSFRLTVDAPNASFRQNIAEYPLPTLDVEVPQYSTVTRTVFVDPPQTQIRIDVVEIDEPGGSVIPAGLTASILLNPDSTNPPVYDPYNPEQFLYYEYHNPRVENPRVENYDLTDISEMNPRVLNPRVENPRVLNPRVLNPRVENLGLLNPRVENISFLNPEMENPRVENPRVENTAMADVVWEVGNEGNTTSIYTLTMLSEAVVYDEEGNPSIPDEDIITQILVYKIHTTPATTPEDDCILGEEHSDELLLNITNPRVENPRVWNPRVENPRVENPRVENPRVENATFALAPGEEAYVIWRIWDDEVPASATSGGLSIGDIIGPVDEYGVPEAAGAALSAHAANTEDVEQDVYDPPVSMSANVAPEIGYSPSSLDFTAPIGGVDDSLDLFINNSGEAILDYTLSIEYDTGVDWLSLDLYLGQSTAGDPANLHVATVHPSGLLEGTYEADIVIEAPAALNSPQEVHVTLTIAPAITISGQVTEGGLGLQSVTMDGLPGTVTTNEFGEYTGTVFVGWSGTVTPTKTGYDFTPPDRTYVDVSSSQANQDYTATLLTYTISGTVSGNLEGVVMSGLPANPSTNASGYYIDTVGYGWDGTVTPSKTGYDFTPPDRTYVDVSSSQANQDYTATLLTYTISGTVLLGVEGLREVTMIGLPGTPTPETDVNGDYSGTVDYNWSGTVTPVKTGFTFFPSSQTYSNVTADQINQDYTVAGVPSYVISGTVTSEGLGLQDVDMGGLPGAPKTDINGDYSGTVDLGWSGTVTPEKVGYTFFPVDQNYFDVHSDQSDQDYTASRKEEWIARYNGTGNDVDQANDIAFDSSGNVYVTGHSAGSGTGKDIVTIKYDSNGNQQWAVRYGGTGSGDDEGEGIAVDSSGNVYVAGWCSGSTTSFDYYTAKYNSSGGLIWDETYDSGISGFDKALAMTIDSSGNVYVTGDSVATGTSEDITTIKYDTNGSQQWVARYNGTASSADWGTGIVVDSSGNVYVTGQSFGSTTGYDITTIKYDSSGDKQWDVTYDGPEVTSWDYAFGIALDPSGNVCVTGKIAGSGTGYDYYTAKYANSNGALLWDVRYDGPSDFDDTPYDIAVDSSGNVYVTGYHWAAHPGGSSKKYYTVKYNGSSGAVVWDASYSGPTNGHDIATALTVDSSGNVYVTGHTYSGSFTDIATVKYDSAGNLLWVARHNGPGNQSDSGTAIAVDSGYVYVTGYSYTNATNAYDYTTIKYRNIN